MIKGCNKRVIVMKETGNDMIEQAIFIIRPEAENLYTANVESDILRQANLILESRGAKGSVHTRDGGAHGKKRKIAGSFAFGVLLGALAASLVFLVL